MDRKFVDDPQRAADAPPSASAVRGQHLWAKSADSGEGHSLLAHMLDVALVASELVQRRRVDARVIAAELGVDEPQAAAWLAVLAGLHDLGKATPAFQSMWPAGAPPEALGRAYAPIPHGLATIVLLNPWLRDIGFSKRVASVIAHAVGIHHGWVASENEFAFGAYDPRSIGEDQVPWSTWRQHLCSDLRDAFGAIEVPTAKRFPATRVWARVAGLTAVADWLGSSLPHRGRVDDVRAYLSERRADVDARLAEVDWTAGGPWWSVPDGLGFGAWFEEPVASSPRPLQLAVEEAFGAGATAPGLLIVEAPMGEGKTEAAFFAMVRSGSELGAYYALPTQATSDAMVGRLRSFVERHRRRDVQLALAHAGARVAPAVHTTPIDGEGAAADATATAWFSTGRRELLAELGVGTVDQALLGVLPTKHHFVRLWALAGRTLVIDEVHAYDAYTGGLVEALVEWAASLDATVVLMSATLPSATSSRLVAAYTRGRGLEVPPALPSVAYPRLTTVDRAGEARRHPFSASRESDVRFVSAPYGTDELAQAVLVAAGAGAAVGVVLNRVDRAQVLYERLRGRHPDVLLLHARLPKRERSRREQAIVRQFGPDGDAAQRGAVVVGTQVIEQSLDLDFDVLFTDLAPIDLMLQRSGRLHRHSGRRRPAAHRSPVVHVAGFGSDVVAGPDPAAVDSVYDAHVLWRSWAVLVTCGGAVRMPVDLDGLVQTVYGDDVLVALAAHADRVAHDHRMYGERTAKAAAAASSWAIPTPLRAATEGWGPTASDEPTRAPWLLRASTRLGEDVVAVVPVSVTSEGWAVAGDALHVPVGAWRAPSVWIERALDQQIRVSRLRVLWALRTRTTPAWWAKSGPLKYMAPLELDAAGCWVVDPTVRLDAELGLVYGPLEERGTE